MPSGTSQCTCGRTWTGYHCGSCHRDFLTTEELVAHWDRKECPSTREKP